MAADATAPVGLAGLADSRWDTVPVLAVTVLGVVMHRNRVRDHGELSHQEPGWRLTEVGETIPFSTAFLAFPQIQTPTSERLSESVAERYNLTTA